VPRPWSIVVIIDDHPMTCRGEPVATRWQRFPKPDRITAEPCLVIEACSGGVIPVTDLDRDLVVAYGDRDVLTSA
jgi:hypothetical protein